jgi:hypothetical protein
MMSRASEGEPRPKLETQPILPAHARAAPGASWDQHHTDQSGSGYPLRQLVGTGEGIRPAAEQPMTENRVSPSASAASSTSRWPIEDRPVRLEIGETVSRPVEGNDADARLRRRHVGESSSRREPGWPWK